MKKQLIFYGAGRYAEYHLDNWLKKNLIPVCFADADECKHYKFMRSNEGLVFEILPLDEAITRYPNYELCITVIPNTAAEVYKTIPLPVERIRLHPEHKKMPQHCPRIGRDLVIFGYSGNICCMGGGGVSIPFTNNIKEDIERYYMFCRQLRDDLNEGKLTSCTGCFMLQEGRSDKDVKLQNIALGSGIAGSKACNFKCRYCSYIHNITKGNLDGSNNVLEILQYLAKLSSIEAIDYSAGELSVSPYVNDILELWKTTKWKGSVLTNASIYLEGLYDLLNEKNILINVSLDAGTAETFAKIKNVDCFEEVVGNLAKYAMANGHIQLKYVLLEGINCNEADINGFVSIARKINAEVIISRDGNLNTFMSDNVYKSLKYLAQQCISQSIHYSVFKDFMVVDFDRLKKDGFLV